jgi:hypothetical protein
MQLAIFLIYLTHSAVEATLAIILLVNCEWVISPLSAGFNIHPPPD